MSENETPAATDEALRDEIAAARDRLARALSADVEDDPAEVYGAAGALLEAVEDFLPIVERVRAEARIDAIRECASWVDAFDQPINGFDRETGKSIATGLRAMANHAEQRFAFQARKAAQR